MHEYRQLPYRPASFTASDFADNPEPRCACVLLLDTSASMSGRPILELNAALSALRAELSEDPLAAKRIELAVVTFGPARLHADFASVEDFEPAPLAATGDTPLGQAIELALDLIEERKSAYRSNGIAYYRPWIFLITDGAPTDAWKAAAARVHEAEGSRRVMFFAVGVVGADLDVLRAISVREPLRLTGLKFRELFAWLSNSLSTVSRSRPSEAVQLEDPTGPKGWARLE